MSDSLDTADLNLMWGMALCEGLRAGGVEQLFISPGSRSTPLALAAARMPALRIRVVLDERAAAFMALGAARAGGRPVALIATSGTAVAEWLPAVAEADLARLPLILLSADRPPEQRHCGANQTIQQGALFGERARLYLELPLPEAALMQAACRYAVQAVATARWPLPGPVHLNIPLREPLTPGDEVVPPAVTAPAVSRPRLQADPVHLDEIGSRIGGRPGLIVCGPETGAPLPGGAIAALAAALDVPILADPLSNLRDGLHDRCRVISRYDACLRQPAFAAVAEPQWVLRFGAQPVSKLLGQFLYAPKGVMHILVDAGGRWPDPLHRTTDLLQAEALSVAEGLTERVRPAPAGYLKVWREREAVVAEAMAAEVPEEAKLIGILGRCLPAGTRLFSGNSLPIRQLDWFHGGRSAPLHITCNRGASGIDGNVATLLGMSTVGKPVVGLLGDLTLLHDIGTLAEHQGLNAVLLVLDNDGGAIFTHLPQSRLAEHEALFLTPRRVDLAAAAQAFGIGYQALDLPGLEDALANALQTGGVHLLHLRLDRRHSLAAHQALWTRLAE